MALLEAGRVGGLSTAIYVSAALLYFFLVWLPSGYFVYAACVYEDDYVFTKPCRLWCKWSWKKSYLYTEVLFRTHCLFFISSLVIVCAEKGYRQTWWAAVATVLVVAILTFSFFFLFLRLPPPQKKTKNNNKKTNTHTHTHRATLGYAALLSYKRIPTNEETKKLIVKSIRSMTVDSTGFGEVLRTRKTNLGLVTAANDPDATKRFSHFKPAASGAAVQWADQQQAPSSAHSDSGSGSDEEGEEEEEGDAPQPEEGEGGKKKTGKEEEEEMMMATSIQMSEMEKDDEKQVKDVKEDDDLIESDAAAAGGGGGGGGDSARASGSGSGSGTGTGTGTSTSEKKEEEEAVLATIEQVAGEIDTTADEASGAESKGGSDGGGGGGGGDGGFEE